ncbi:hypothetical protein EXIGLDRAFT_18683 [Exidia glandulosa HHB12029]|uniref:HBS1-like protein N-terminal domain-containing protein n=1 Tax=Exidia glandulosa HHB12029 TaxID=1314781 RepID=A0A165QX46_EXIGL|nr:hypothetical protein EXIGLDRAFT_18683 [Exidia glandulosa HHB12029]
MTPEQHLQLATAASKVREIVGAEDVSGITDQEISDTVWNLYFDVEASVDAILKEKARKAAAAERKDDPPPAPISALQRLSLAHVQSADKKKPSLAALAQARASASASRPAATSVSPIATAPSSKLAAIAARHRQNVAASAVSPAANRTGSLATSAAAPSPSPGLSKLAARAAASSARPASSPSLSKLAAKAQSLRSPPPPPEPEPEPQPVLDSPAALLFNSTNTWSLAKPSAFGTLLASQNRMHEPAHISGVTPTLPALSAPFAFNVPSPDDVVMEARRGTSLATHAPSTSFRSKE